MLSATAPHALSLLLLSVALVIWPASRAVARQRLRRLAAYVEPAEAGRGLGPRTDAGAQPGVVEADPPELGAHPRRRPLVFGALAGSAVLASFPSVAGGLVAVATGGVCFILLGGMSMARSGPGRIGRLAGIRWPDWRPRQEGDPGGSLPFAIDLLAVCLRAGMPTSSAMRSVARNLSGAGRPRQGSAMTPESGIPGACIVLARVAAACELGSEPTAAWEEWLAHPAYGQLARALVVTGESGSAVAARLEAVSRHLRVAAGQQAVMRAQRAGIVLMAPLGLCFLPAFVCLGVVPVVAGIAGRVFG